MNLRRGDVVLAAFPNDDLRSFQSRPGLVVPSSGLATELPRVVLAGIRSRVDLVGPTRLRVDMARPEGKEARLRTDSLIFLDYLTSVPKQGIRHVLGHYPAMAGVDRILRRLLDL